MVVLYCNHTPIVKKKFDFPSSQTKVTKMVFFLFYSIISYMIFFSKQPKFPMMPFIILSHYKKYHN